MGFGYCNSHYRRFKRYGDPMGKGRRRSKRTHPCSVEGCEEIVFSRQWCKAHYAVFYRTSYSEKLAEAHLQRMGLTKEQYAKLAEAQDNRCAICNRADLGPAQRWGVDHDHACCPKGRACSGCIRGLLCVNCNAGLGNFKDDPAILASAIKYLERVSKGRGTL